MKPHLRPCPACARHVRVVDMVCPFCNHALPDQFRAAQAPPLLPLLKMCRSRAAILALGATLVGAPACDGDPPTTDAAADGRGSDGGKTDADAGGGGGTGGSDARDGGGSDGAGGADAVEAGAIPDGRVDGNPDVDGAIAAMYGAPPNSWTVGRFI